MISRAYGLRDGGRGHHPIQLMQFIPLRARVRPLILYCLCVAFSARPVVAQDPASPPGGFPIVTFLGQPLVLDDAALSAVDVLYPDDAIVAVPAAGWPVLVMCHPWAGSRTDYTTGLAADFARQGYFVVTYDIRGHGLFATHPANAGKRSDFGGVRDRRDLKLVIETVLGAFPALTDGNRVGVFGFSLGAGLAWSAAAWSGQQCDDVDPGFGAFPTIKAVAALAWDPGFASAFAPGQTSQSTRISELLLAMPALLDPTVHTALAAASDAENFSALYAFGLTNRDVLARLSTTTVPILHGHSFGDRIFSPAGAAYAMSLLPPSTPRRLMLSSIGDHGSLPNMEESDLSVHRLFAWFEARLKGRDNPADATAAVEWAVEPADFAVAGATDSIWSRRVSSAWPPPEAQPWRLNLTGAGAASTLPPPGTQPARLLVQGNPSPPLSAAALRALGFDQATLRARVPQGELIYAGPTVTQPLEFAGSFTARIDIAPISSAWQMSVAFGVVGPNGFRSLATAAVTERGPNAVLAGPRTFTSDPFAASIPAGATLEIRIRSQASHDGVPATPGEIRVVPVLQSFAYGVRHGGTTSSYIDFPLLSSFKVGAALVADRYAVSLSSPEDVHFTLHGGQEGIAEEAIIGLSLSGWQPGLPLGALTLPLNFDGLSVLMLSAYDTWPFAGFVGTCDSNGHRVASIAFTPAWLPLSLAGLTMHSAGLIFGPNGVIAVTNPVGLTLTL